MSSTLLVSALPLRNMDIYFCTYFMVFYGVAGSCKVSLESSIAIWSFRKGVLENSSLHVRRIDASIRRCRAIQVAICINLNLDFTMMI